MRLATVAIATLIATIAPNARAVEVEDATSETSTSMDAEPGPRLPNGEPLPPPDLTSDVGGCSCRTAGGTFAWPLSLFVIAFALRRARPRGEQKRKRESHEGPPASGTR